MSFIGRFPETRKLRELYQTKESNLVVIYGRRRVGKSTLVEEFIRDKPSLSFEGLESVDTQAQLKQVMHDIVGQTRDQYLSSVQFESWASVFDYLTAYFARQENKTVLFMDELQWLAVNRTLLVSLIKKYWDKQWKNQNVMLILCGSVSSYMAKRVINSKALYGRINWELCLQPLLPNETFKLLDGKRGKQETFLYSLVLGGIPKYLQEIKKSKSFDQNINELFFTKNALFVEEYNRVFYSQFKEYRTYEAIANYLKDKPRSLDEIAKALKLSSGGSMTYYLDNLEKAAFITSYVPYDKGLNSKLKKYKLTDEYLRFYFKYIMPNLKLIKTNQKRNLFSQLIKPTWLPWLGFSFENFCLKYANELAEFMGFADMVTHWGPYFSQGSEGFQIDLLYKRIDNVITVCEIKFHSQPIGVTVIKEVERKCQLLKVSRGYTIEKAIISRYGTDESVKALEYFHYDIMVEDFFKD